MILTKYFEKTVEDTRDIPALKSKMNYIYIICRGHPGLPQTFVMEHLVAIKKL